MIGYMDTRFYGIEQQVLMPIFICVTYNTNPSLTINFEMLMSMVVLLCDCVILILSLKMKSHFCICPSTGEVDYAELDMF